MRTHIVPLTVALAALLSGMPVAAGDWLHFGADAVYSGHSPNETQLTPATVAGLERRWGVGCDDGWFSVISRSPAIRSGTLYTSQAGGPLSAFDAATGQLRWQFGGTMSGWAPPPVASAGGTVLYLEGSFPTELYAVDGATGAELWQAPLGFDLGYDDTAVVTVDEERGLVYLVEEPFAPGEGRLFALDLATGEVAWFMGPATDGMGFKGDHVLLHGGRIYVVAVVEEEYWERDRALAFDATTRQLVASFLRPADLELYEISKISICGGRLLVNYCDRDDVFEGDGTLVAYDLQTGREVWRLDPGTAITGRVACNEAAGRCYVPTDPYLYALDSGTGVEVWRHLFFGEAYGPSLANGVVYVLSDTNLYALDEATGQQLFRFGLGEQAYDTTQVAIADGMVYFSGNGGTCDLFALGLPGGGPTGSADGVIPAAASNPGGGGTYWGTTVWAFQDQAASATLTLRAGNEAVPASAVQPLEVTVPRGRVVRLDDVLASFPEVAPPAALLYAWDGVDPERAVVTSRTFTAASGGAAGTLGQGIPGVDLALLPTATTSQIVPLSPDEGLVRSNLGVVNAGNAEAAVLVRLRSESGSVLAESRFTLAAGAWRQLSRVFDAVGIPPAARAYAEVKAEGATSALLAVYASLVDNATGDPTYLAAQVAQGGGEVIVPVAAHNWGQAGSRWVTDVSLLNWAGSDGAVCGLDLLAEGVANHPSPAGSQTFAVGAEDQLVLPDVVLSVYGESNRKGALAVASAQGMGCWSRTYNAGGVGTYGQDMPGLAVSDYRVSGDDRGELVGLEESVAFRTNLGLVNTSTEVCTVTVELYSAAGVRLGTVGRTLLPRSMEQVQAPFAALGGVEDGRATVTSDRGVIAYASVVDNATGDATTVLAKRVR